MFFYTTDNLYFKSVQDKGMRSRFKKSISVSARNELVFHVHKLHKPNFGAIPYTFFKLAPVLWGFFLFSFFFLFLISDLIFSLTNGPIIERQRAIGNTGITFSRDGLKLDKQIDK